MRVPKTGNRRIEFKTKTDEQKMLYEQKKEELGFKTLSAMARHALEQLIEGRDMASPEVFRLQREAASCAVSNDVVKAHLPQFSPVHAIARIEEQTTVVKRREPQARISVGVGRGVVRVVLCDVNDHPRRAVGRVVRPKFSARAVG